MVEAEDGCIERNGRMMEGGWNGSLEEIESEGVSHFQYRSCPLFSFSDAQETHEVVVEESECERDLEDAEEPPGLFQAQSFVFFWCAAYSARGPRRRTTFYEDLLDVDDDAEGLLIVVK